MARILITSGPTRQHIDPVRYLTNASSGRMGKALVEAGLAHGHEVVVISGPVEVTYPRQARVISVTTTDEMLSVALREFVHCQGVIGVAVGVMLGVAVGVGAFDTSLKNQLMSGSK